MDSSILLLSIRFRLNLLEEIGRITSRSIEYCIIPQVLEELKAISDRGGKPSGEARLVLQYLDNFEILDFRYDDMVDEAIIQAAKRFSMAVATADVKLRRKLRRMKVPVITLKGKKLYCQPEDPEFWFI